MGNGRFSDKLSLEDWETFNNYQRAHYNYIEGMGTILTFLMVGGLFFPKPAAIAGVSYIVGRFLYTFGYRNSGPKGRMVGALVLDLALLSLLGMSSYGLYKFIRFGDQL